VTRLSRFSALVDSGDGILSVHVPNSGRLRELLVPAARVWLAPPGWLGPGAFAGNVGRGRRTAADLLLVEAPSGLVCVDAHLPPLLVAEAIRDGGWQGLPAGRALLEPRWGRGRFDLALEGWMIECKSVTLVRQGVALFPDAPTERGRRHLEGLASIGARAAVVFVVQRADACRFAPNRETDPAFASALEGAARRGVLILAGRCRVSLDEIVLAERLPVHMSA
jgi:sugar fermentation stimulation protein A